MRGESCRALITTPELDLPYRPAIAASHPVVPVG
jgi:hypothetical protein